MKTLNIGLVGAGFMCKAHNIAYDAYPACFWPIAYRPRKYMIADVTQERAQAAADQYAFEKATGDWHDVVNDPKVDMVDICVPNNMHAEIAVAAAKAGKHIMCEKPISNTLQGARDMWDAAKKAGIINMLCFNYRMTPAVLLAKKFVEEGAIGDILDFRGTYLQDWSADPESPLSWRFEKDICGSGTFGDIATHIVDILIFLCGEFDEANGHFATYINERPIQTSNIDTLGVVKGKSTAPRKPVEVDDMCCIAVKTKAGAFGTIEATRNAWGRNNFITFEVHGTKGSLYFNYERRDELQVCFEKDDPDRRGFRTIYTGPNSPYGANLWPIPALGIGYTETKIVELAKFLDAIESGKQVSPNFEDGLKIELFGEAAFKSAQTGLWEKIGKV